MLRGDRPRPQGPWHRRYPTPSETARHLCSRSRATRRPPGRHRRCHRPTHRRSNRPAVSHSQKPDKLTRPRRASTRRSTHTE
ncbi:hypothetical protein FKG95_11965 [Denitrobaculum tricleocarpae]|uniref:Uncharacterized protein n=1 Tax=Denitrobaculum tricleocarpae TaxID=2591009 RepID=A0A545TUF8_9PROT|nr:hypothetical protein FKG95_11965 [Denitrobaculum tricleocarpae]